MPNLIDVSSFQPDTLSYFQIMKKNGVEGVCIKITEGSANGSNYKNPKRINQFKNAITAGLKVSAYHFARYVSTADAQEEAKFFAQTLQEINATVDIPVMLDAEILSMTDYTAGAEAFINQLKALSYKHFAIYSYQNMWDQGLLNMDRIKKLGALVWIANPNVTTRPNNADIWQSSAKFLTYSQDINNDYNGMFSGKCADPDIDPNGNKPDVDKTGYTDQMGVFWRYQVGDFTPDRAINLRWGASPQSTLISVIPKGQVIKYDAYAYANGYVYIRQPRGNNTFGYMATGNAVGKVRTSRWGSFK